jgi:hypothetical protein
MRARSIVTRLMALPLRHKLIAAGIELAVIAACLAWSRHLPPQEYRSSALLSFDGSAAGQMGPGGEQTNQIQPVALATSILSDEVLKTLCWQVGLFPDDPGGGEAARFRSSLMLSLESPSNLRVTWRGADRSQTMAATNSVAVLLTSWVPENATQQPLDSAPSAPSPPPPPPAPEQLATPAPATEPSPRIAEVQARLGQLGARLETVLNEEQALELELATTDQRLTILGEEARRLEESIRHANEERQSDLTARQPLVALLASEKKNLEVLRARYTDAYPDVEAAQERIAEVEKRLAALPAIRPAPDTGQSRLTSVTRERNNLGAGRARLSRLISEKTKLETNLRSQEAERSAEAARLEKAETQGLGKLVLSESAPAAASPPVASSVNGDRMRPFTVLEPAGDAQPTDSRHSLLNWIGAVVGPLCAILYLVMAVWWFRAVRDVETLERIVPDDVAYLGAIPGMNTWRRNV